MKFGRASRSFLPSLVLLLLAAPAALQGQESVLDVGTRVRVVAPPFTGGPMIGSVVAVGDSSIALATPGGSRGGEHLVIPREAIERLEISLGTRPNTVKGLEFGALGGVLLGAGAMGLACSGDEACGEGSSAAERAVLGAVIGAAAGAVVGGVVGTLVRTERWESVEGVRPGGEGRR